MRAYTVKCVYSEILQMVFALHSIIKFNREGKHKNDVIKNIDKLNLQFADKIYFEHCYPLVK